ncbi:uncharacterized protein CMU_040170 [Cryptosporidium muris RN66]|uniref:Uncharacterized protein n=1 Tax=Cryptosporidium muris (strain RN66) TaxID=441375 RepID=B6A9Q7_CRYMR|nr:uncharacterized protein CMU_040170 [Cryptosporidium muris RN66]EEA04948.1 hypothetical protein, conserved [Cryptosporidium muris RN66]|eukprot:XP_002139297.1 hypothetical protein [Cryptosporidium muris RN66]
MEGDQPSVPTIVPQSSNILLPISGAPSIPTLYAQPKTFVPVDCRVMPGYPYASLAGVPCVMPPLLPEFVSSCKNTETRSLELPEPHRFHNGQPLNPYIPPTDQTIIVNAPYHMAQFNPVNGSNMYSPCNPFAAYPYGIPARDPIPGSQPNKTGFYAY